MNILFNPDLLPELIGEILSYCARFELSQLALINKQWYQRIRPLLECDLHAGITYHLGERAMEWQGKESYGVTYALETSIFPGSFRRNNEDIYAIHVCLATSDCTLTANPELVTDGHVYPFKRDETPRPSRIYDSCDIATTADIKTLGPTVNWELNTAQKALCQRLVSGQFHGVALLNMHKDYICCIADYPALCDELHRVAEIAWRHYLPFNFELTPFYPLLPPHPL